MSQSEGTVTQAAREDMKESSKELDGSFSSLSCVSSWTTRRTRAASNRLRVVLLTCFQEVFVLSHTLLPNSWQSKSCHKSRSVDRMLTNVKMTRTRGKFYSQWIHTLFHSICRHVIDHVLPTELQLKPHEVPWVISWVMDVIISSCYAWMHFYCVQCPFLMLFTRPKFESNMKRSLEKWFFVETHWENGQRH